MAFGSIRTGSPLTASVASVTNPTNATGSCAVSVGDLIWVTFGQQTALTAASVTDNLHGATTYTAVNAGTDAGTSTIRCFFHRVTVAGTLTTVAVAATASTNDASCVVTVIEGPFAAAPLDANPANTTDGTSPFTLTATGTRAQPIEVVMAGIAISSNQTVAAVSPATLAGTVARANVSTGNSVTVFTNDTATYTASFTGTDAVSAQTVASFEHDSAFTVGVPIQLGMGAGTHRPLYYQARFGPVREPDAPVVTDAYGWWPQVNLPVRHGASLALLAAGLVFVPTPPKVHAAGWQQPLSIAAPARKAQQGGAVWVGQPLAGNNVDLGKWQQPLSIAAQRPPVQLGQAFVPFDTAQLAATPAIYWQQPASVAPPRLSPPQSELRQFTVTVAAAIAAVEGWQGQTSQAPPRRSAPQSELRQFAVNVVAPAPEGWQAPLSRPVDRRPLLQPDFRQFSVPEPEVAAAAATEGWQAALSVAPQPRPLIRVAHAPFGVEVPEPVVYGWWQPLSRAAPIPRAPQGTAFVPFNTAQVVAVAVYGWQQPLSVTPRKLPTAQTPLAPFAVDVEEDNTVTIDKWLVPLSKAAPIPRYQVGTTFVPFNTAQIVVAPSYGWFAPLSAAAASPPVGPGGPSYVFLSTAFTQNTATYQGYQQPLSRAVPRPRVWQGQVAWIATPQAGNTVDIGKWQQPLSRPVDRPPVWQGTALVPLDTAQVVVTPSYGWQQPLSITPRKLPTAQTPLAPFAVDVAQIVSVTPEQFGWYAPLSTLASTKSPGQVAVTLLGWTFVPWDTVQVIPPPPVGGVQPPGYWYEQWERIAERQGKRKKPAPELVIAVDEIPADWQPSKVFKVSPRVIEALAQAKTVDDIRALARQETGQVRNMLNMVIAEHKRRMKDEDDIEIILLTWS